MDNIKTTQFKLLDIKTLMCEMKNTLDIIKQIKIMEGSIRELENRVI